jgi:DNA-binding transcriptional regulator PaaX
MVNFSIKRNKISDKYKIKNFRMGPTMQKVLLLLEGGLALGLTGHPNSQFRIIKGVAKEWQAINRRVLREAIRNLYKSQMIDYKENNNNTVSLILSDNGKNKILQFNLDKMEIKKPAKWDKIWRMVIFDIPENLKAGRNALSAKLKNLGFYPLQKSVFIFPYECKNEVDFIVEIFNLRPYVRFLIVKETDIDLDLKNHFELL